MATLLADSPPAPADGQSPPPDGALGAPAQAPDATPPDVAGEHMCTNCGAAMANGQEWCLQCGAGEPGSLGSPSWRAPAALLAAVGVLVLGAAAAAYAALSKGTGKPRVVTVARALVPAATTPGLGASTPGVGASSPPAGTPGAIGTAPKSKLGLGTVKPPKIPLSAATPKASEKSTTTPASTGANTGTSTSTTPSSSSTSTTPSRTSTSGAGEESQQAAILLDTDAASPYNPYGYPGSWFGDPSLAIDGDTATAFTAQVNPVTAPKMAVGLLIDLKAKQRVSALQLITSTPGMAVQVYGTSLQTAPNSITDPTWTPLSAPKVVKKKHTRIALRDSSKAFTFVTLWISKAPQASVGTPEAPGHVDINEVELFPPA